MFPEYNPKDIEKTAQDKWLKETWDQLFSVYRSGLWIHPSRLLIRSLPFVRDCVEASCPLPQSRLHVLEHPRGCTTLEDGASRSCAAHSFQLPSRSRWLSYLSRAASVAFGFQPSTAVRFPRVWRAVSRLHVLIFCRGYLSSIDLVVVLQQRSLCATTPHNTSTRLHRGPSSDKIWGVLVFLSIVTAVEVALGIIKPSVLLTPVLGMKGLNWIFIILTLVKAYYIACLFRLKWDICWKIQKQ